MFTKKLNRRWIKPSLAILAVTFSTSVLAENPKGFSKGMREAHGDRFDTAKGKTPLHQLTPQHYANFEANDGDDDDVNASALNLNDGKTRAWGFRRWNRIAMDASGLDHTPVPVGGTRVFGEQLGPVRASRAMAIAHIAMFDALNTVLPKYERYAYKGALEKISDISIRAAVAQAAHDTLSALFPSQASTFAILLAEDLDKIKNKKRKSNGVALGKKTAAAILALRANDGSEPSDPNATRELRMGIEYIPESGPGVWRQDPISLVPIALGAYWGQVKPFVMTSGSQFRIPSPPAMNSPEYKIAYDEVRKLGGDGIITPTQRTEEQTQIGIYWGYDGTPSLCAPPRLYNQIAVQLALGGGVDLSKGKAKKLHALSRIEFARMLTMLNVAMADAGIASWESKFYYKYWRPVTAIREADTDGNSSTDRDANFTPLGAPATNLHGPDFTPPFPAYPSGHGTFGGALFQTLRNIYRTDKIGFTFVSDEYDGKTVDNDGGIRPLKPRSFTSLSQAEEENGQSRIYLGIHFSFDKTEAIPLGNKVANHVFANIYKPVRSQ